MNDTLINGAALRYHRTAAGLTRQELAARSGIRRETVGRLENGKRNGTPAQIQALAEALGITVDSLLAPVPPEVTGVCPTCGGGVNERRLIVCNDDFHDASESK